MKVKLKFKKNMKFTLGSILALIAYAKKRTMTVKWMEPKICPEEPLTCPTGKVYDTNACMCFSETNCDEKCEFEFMLDPREYCTCISEDEALKLWYD